MIENVMYFRISRFTSEQYMEIKYKRGRFSVDGTTF